MPAQAPEPDHRADVEAEDVGEELESAAPAVRELNEEVLHPAGGRSVSDFAKVFHALGHAARLAALYELYEMGGCTYSDLSEALNAEENNLNYHLRLLIGTPLINKTPSAEDGRVMIYQLTPMGERIAGYIVDMMETERDVIEDEYLDSESMD